MIKHGTKLGPGADMLGRQRSHAGPAGGRLPQLAAPLMKLRESDQRHQMPLVGLKCGFERGAFRIIVTGNAVNLGKVQPQRRGLGVGLDRRFEMAPGCVDIFTGERVHAEDIVSDRVIGSETDRGFGFADGIGATALLLRLRGERQMLF